MLVVQCCVQTEYPNYMRCPKHLHKYRPFYRLKFQTCSAPSQAIRTCRRQILVSGLLQRRSGAGHQCHPTKRQSSDCRLRRGLALMFHPLICGPSARQCRRFPLQTLQPSGRTNLARRYKRRSAHRRTRLMRLRPTRLPQRPFQIFSCLPPRSVVFSQTSSVGQRGHRTMCSANLAQRSD